MDWLIEFRVKAEELTLIHYISFTQEQLCTRLATQRFYVHYDATLKEANKLTAVSYFYDDIGNCALQNVQVTGLCAIMNSGIIMFFSFKVTLLCLPLLFLWLHR
jgi:hypothetical protein